jgi:hypothetical protein
VLCSRFPTGEAAVYAAREIGTMYAKDGFGMLTLTAAPLLFQLVASTVPPAELILAAVARTSAIRHEVAYSGWRKYSIDNQRFSKSATLTVRVESKPGRGKQFTISERTGSPKLISVVEDILSLEAEASRPGQAGAHEIGPQNYRASVRGSESIEEYDCWVLALVPKLKNKYVVNGTVWVDKKSFGIVRLVGTLAASISMWAGTPRITEYYAPVNGIWVPVHTVAKSKSMFLGESNLDIRHMDYEVSRSNAAAATLPPMREDAGRNPRADIVVAAEPAVRRCPCC